MKKNSWRFLILAFILNMTLVPASAQEPATSAQSEAASEISAADLLPADTIFFFSIPDMSRTREDLKALALWRIYEEPSVKTFFEQGIPLLAEFKKKAEGETGLSWAEFQDLFQGEVALAFIGLEFEEEFSEPHFKAALALEEPVDTEKWQKLLDYLDQSAVENGAEKQSEEFEGRPLVRLIWPEMTLTYSYIGDYFILTTSELAWEEVTRVAQEGGESLSQNPTFIKMRKETAPPDSFSFTYINIDNIWAEYAEDIPPQALEALEASGLLGLKALAGASFREENGVKDRVYVYAPGERKGIFLAIPEKTADASLLKFVPADALSFELGAFSWEILWRQIKTVLEVSLPEEMYFEFEETLAFWEKEVEIDLESELLRPLGEDYLFYSKESEAAGILLVSQAMPDQVFIISLEDSASFRPAYDKLITYLKGKSAEWSLGEGPAGEPYGTQAQKIVFKEAEHDEYRIDYVIFPGIFFPFQPAAAVTEDFLVISLSPMSARSALSRLKAPGPNIGENQDFLAALAHLPGKKIALSYRDTARIWKKGYETVQASLFMFAGSMEEPFIDPSLLPPAEDIFRHFFGTGMSTVRVEDGWIGESYSTLGTGVSLAAAGSLGVGMALPAVAPDLVKPRAEAQKAVCKSNLKQIGLALLIYANDYEYLPQSLDQLTPDYITKEGILHCPSDKQKEGISYIYRNEARGKKIDEIDAPGRYAVVYDKPGNHTGGRNVVFADGHVEWMSERAFQVLLKGEEALSPLAKKRCKENLQEIGLAAMTYAFDKDEYPGSFQDLLSPEYLMYEGLLQCPGEGNSSTEVDYELVPLGKTSSVMKPQEMVLAYDKEGNHAGGRWVLFADGHTEFLSEAVFQERLAATKRMLQEVAR